MSAKIELEVYCDECNASLEAEVTGNAILVKGCEQCMNLRSMVEVDEALKGERTQPEHEDIVESSPEEVRKNLGQETVKEGAVSLDDLAGMFKQFSTRLDDIEGR